MIRMQNIRVYHHAIARQLRDYIFSLDKEYINATQEYTAWLQTVNAGVGQFIEEQGGLPALCSNFPQFLFWEIRQDVPGLELIWAIMPRNTIRERTKRLQDGVPAALNVAPQQFTIAYNLLARFTVRLSGLSSFSTLTFYQLKELLRDCIRTHPNQLISRSADEIFLEVIIIKNPEYANALVYFTVVFMEHLSLTPIIFQYLIDCIVARKVHTDLYIEDDPDPAYPFGPHNEAVKLIPEIWQLWKGNHPFYSQQQSSRPVVARAPVPASVAGASVAGAGAIAGGLPMGGAQNQGSLGPVVSAQNLGPDTLGVGEVIVGLGNVGAAIGAGSPGQQLPQALPPPPPLAGAMNITSSLALLTVHEDVMHTNQAEVQTVENDEPSGYFDADQEQENINQFEAWTPPAYPTEALRDSSKARPDPIGQLLDGLKSRIIDEAKLAQFKDIKARQFAEFKNMVLNEHRWDYHHNPEEGTFIFQTSVHLRIGVGAEASVYIGGMISLQHLPTIADESPVGMHARIVANVDNMIAVAMKAYKHANQKEEIHTFRRMPRNVDGIINYIDHFNYEHSDTLFTVQELGITTLRDVVKLMGPEEKLKAVRAACLSVFELHQRAKDPVVHRDIRCPNFLLSETGALKICDFGLSRVINRNSTTTVIETFSRTELTCQPYEVLNAIQKAESDGSLSVPISLRGDIFMLGLTIFFVLTGTDALNNTSIRAQVIPNLDPIDSCCSSGKLLRHLLSKMLSHNRMDRPTIAEVLQHPFFRSWDENRNTVEQLYRVLHDGGQPVQNDRFQLIQEVMGDIDQHLPWDQWFGNLPPLLSRSIHISGFVPRVQLTSGTVKMRHPLPNLHRCIQWLRHFYVHGFDPQTYTFLFEELQAELGGDPVIGNFIYRHESLWRILPLIWERRIAYSKTIDIDRAALQAAFEETQRKFQSSLDQLLAKERHLRSAFGFVSSSNS